MVDNDMTLTFSLRNNRGVYALLLGSGVSMEAGVPTGWGIVEDLIRDLATAEGEEPTPDPFQWYEDKYDQEPAYDELMEQVGPSKEDRQSILQPYFEPTEEEREEGIKTPSEAHRSIAWLVDEGYINIIITTNFDQLLEQALRERGVNPVVITNATSAAGAEPLAQQDAVILKIHGDYMETNIKNINSELQSYDEEIESRLNRAFSDYGLIVCGWSAEWDPALREALLECESRRYSTYWAYHGSLEEQAERLTEHLSAVPVEIDGASKFFSDLKERVQALEGAESGAPLTREVARERVKRYMTRDSRKIDLSDLIRDERERVYSQVVDEERFPLNIDGTEGNIEQRLSTYENMVGTLMVAVATCAYWGPEVPNPATNDISETVRRLGSPTAPSGRRKDLWDDLRQYPATVMLYGIGTAGVAAKNWDLIKRLLIETETQNGRGIERPVAEDLNPWRVGSRISRRGGNKYLRRRINDVLSELLDDLIPDETRYDRCFAQFKILADLALLDLSEDSRFSPDHLPVIYPVSAIEELATDLEAQGENWGPIQSGMFNSSVDRAESLLEELQEITRF
ncbi:SIR2 family protein [Haloarcula salinisoli]|uniref:SIR2 family protein n=1 Tax=Haloarcula salinisoli TaxID=2487746 RepID=A0A8J8CE75_9EURY|nr:SIR2 family protein [Halomicroarcula salinisoli]MBX0305365.1 SIR2 family protein [Halomicroarcula salinisoli]